MTSQPRRALSSATHLRRPPTISTLVRFARPAATELITAADVGCPARRGSSRDRRLANWLHHEGLEIRFAPYQFGIALPETKTVAWAALADPARSRHGGQRAASLEYVGLALPIGSALSRCNSGHTGLDARRSSTAIRRMFGAPPGQDADRLRTSSGSERGL